jgi:hypothetical protein
MMRRNNTTEVDPTPMIAFNYPSHDEIAAMIRQAQQIGGPGLRGWGWLVLGFLAPPPARRARGPACGRQGLGSSVQGRARFRREPRPFHLFLYSTNPVIDSQIIDSPMIN